MTTKKLTFRQKILVAGTLFGMFFGAGNLIFPVHLGQMAGRNAVVAMIGFIITAVGIPIFGVAAIGITHSDGLQTLSSKVGKGYGIFFTCLLYLTIGPLFAIPRCATVSFTTGITPLLGADSPEWLYLLVFSAAFFAFVLFFSLRPGKITLWIGKIINPLFLFFFAVLIIAALLSPGAAISSVEPTEAYQNGSFFPALIEGYGTMDAIAGLAFGIVVIDVIRRMGVNNDDIIAEDVLSSGLLAGALMALIYVLSILVGAQSRHFRAVRKWRHRPHADRGSLPWRRGPVYPRLHHHLCLPQDLHRPCHGLLGNVCQDDERQNFLPHLGDPLHGVFVCRFQHWTECHHRVFRPDAHAHLSPGHCAYPAGLYRQVLRS